MNKEDILHQYDFNLEYARALVHDIPDERMTFMPGEGLENHPAWTMGHLISGSAGMAEDLGAAFEMPEQWTDLFLRKGPGDPRKPDPDASKYPSKEQLLRELELQHEKVKTLLNTCTEEDLNKPFKWRFSKYMPALRDLLIFMCISHEAMHLAQVAAWRRAMKYPSALATL